MRKYLFEDISKRGKLITISLLVAICFFIAIVFNVYMSIGTAYTQLFFIPVILSGLWFHRRAYAVAAFLGSTHIVLSIVMGGSLEFAPFLRTAVLMIAADMIGNIALRMDLLDSQMKTEREKAMLLNNSVQDIIGRIDKSGQINFISPSVESILGYTPNEAMALTLYNIVHPDEQKATSKLFRQFLVDGISVSLEFRCLDKSKNYIWIEVLLNRADSDYSDGNFATFSCRDIDLRKKNEEIINNISLTDPLTGLKNRRFLDGVIEKEMARSTRYNLKMSIVIIDLDFFKHINDTYGHPAGDSVLIKVARVISETIRSSDIPARLGGEEFLILLPDTGLYGAFSVAEKIRKNIEATPHPEASFVTASFGVAERYENEPVNDLYKRADNALYLAKERGRNRVAVFEIIDEKPVAYISLNWRPSMACGEKEIDKQHMLLFELANSLINAAITKESKEDISEKFDKLLKHIVEHFEYEETAQREAGFPDWKEHTKIHDELVEKALSLKKSFDEDTIKVADLFTFMVDDVTYGHMMVEDIKFYPYLENNYTS